MEFGRQKPKKRSGFNNLINASRALIYENLRGSQANLTGGIIYKLIKPVLFTLLVAIIIRGVRRGLSVEDSIQYLYFNFTLFFFMLDLINSSEMLSKKSNLINLPKVNYFTLLFSEVLGNLVILVPQVFFSFFIFWYFSFDLNYFSVILAILYAYFVGVVYYLIVSLILFRNNVLVQLHQLFSRALLFISCVFFPLSAIPEDYRLFFLLNPFVHVMEFARFAMEYPTELFYSLTVMNSLIFYGILLFFIIYHIRINYFHYRIGLDD